MKRLVLLATLAGSILGACKSPDRGYVQREWSLTLREYGIIPIFPPREDVYVGDVYAYGYDPESLATQEVFEKKFSALTDDQKMLRMQLGLSPRLVRLDLTDEAAVEYQRSPSWPQTSPEFNQIIAAAEFQNIARLVKAEESTITAKKAEAGQAEQGVAAAAENKRLAELAVKATADRKTDATTIRDGLRKPLADARKTLLDEQVKLDAMALNDNGRAAQQLVVTGATTRVKTLTADLAAADAAVVEVELQLSNDTKRVDDATKDIAKHQQKKTDAEAAVVKATTKIESLQTMAKELGGSGSRSLFAQPRDHTYDVFTGRPLPKPFQKDANTRDLDAQMNDLVNSRENRIRLVAFPDFAATTFTQGELSALIPVEAFALGARANFAELKSVSVKVPAAESYCVPLEQVRRQVAATREGTAGEARSDIRNEVEQQTENNRDLFAPPPPAPVWSDAERFDFAERISDAVAGLVQDWAAKPKIDAKVVRPLVDAAVASGRYPTLPPDRFDKITAIYVTAVNEVLSSSQTHVVLNEDLQAAARFQFLATEGEGVSSTNDYYYIRVVTEVFYARALDISLVSRSSFGARAEVETIAAREIASDAAPEPISFQNPQPGASITKDPSTLTAADLVTRTQAQLGERLKVPGGSVQLVSYNDTTIGLRRVFDRPIAIGFRGLTLKVNRNTGLIASVGVPSSGINVKDTGRHRR